MMKLTKYSGNPIISPNPSHQWENLATCNPGVVYDGKLFHMLYRAAGDDEDHVIRFGYAVSEDGFHFKRHPFPVFGPSMDGPDSGCVEDPRIHKFHDEYYITCAYRPMAPGKYWTFPHDVVRLPECGPDAPSVYARNIANTGLAVTSDFRSFRRLGRITKPVLDDRDVIFFPEKIDENYVMIHRPKEYVGSRYGPEYPAIWLKCSDDLMDWEDKPSHLLMTGRNATWEEKIGGSAPPILTDSGWLMLYHGVSDGGTSKYCVGAALLDKDNPLKIIAKSPIPILCPEEPYETQGLYNGCVFPVGNVVVDGTLFVYYGAADKYVGVATCPVQMLLDYLLNECKY